MRRIGMAAITAVIAILLSAGTASAQEVYVTPPGATPDAGEVDRGTAAGSGAGRGELLGRAGEGERGWLATTGIALGGLAALGSGLYAAGRLMRRGSPQTA